MSRSKMLFGQAEEIANLRQRFGVSIRELAEELNVTHSAVYRWNCGFSPCKMSKVREAVKRIVTRRYEEAMICL